LKDIDKAELEDMINQIKVELDLPNDDLEKTIESGFDVLKQVYDVYDLVKDFFKKED